MTSRFLKLFPPPSFLDVPRVGLDISDEAVRWIELVPHAWGARVGRWGEELLPAGVVESGHINDQDKLVNILKSVRERHRLHYVTASLPEEKVYLYKTSIPKVEKHEIRNALEFTIEENVPIAPGSAIFTYKVIKKETPSDTLEVSVGVLPEKVVSTYFETLERAGLIPLDFYIEGIAIVNSVIASGRHGTYMIVNLTEKCTGVYVVSEDVVRFTSTLPINGDTLTKALQKSLSVSFEEARKLKREEGILDNKKAAAELLAYSVNTVSALKDELHKVMIYWNTHDAGNKEIEMIYVCGENSALVELDKYLDASMRIPAVKANVWCNAFSLDDYVPPIQYYESLNFAVPVGLALSGIK